MLFLVHFLFFILIDPRVWATSSAFPESEGGITLPPIEVNGSAGEALFYDPVVPTQEAQIQTPSPSGTILRELSDSLPVPITEEGLPGTLSQFRGLGRTVEDTNVQTLGIPLNPPQGGGFDFSTFPQFFWSSYQFRLGPGGTAYDPRASTGALSLTPWTADALKSNEAGGRVTFMGGRLIGQSSVGVHEGAVAALVGGTFGFETGPTGSLSVQLPSTGKLEIRVHLLATDIHTPLGGPIDLPTPDDHQTSARVIPVLEGSLDLGEGRLVKSSVFFDRSWLRYDDVDGGASSNTRSDQVGIENAILWGAWTVGASAKLSSFEGVTYFVPNEASASMRAGPTYRLGSVTLDGFLSGDSVSGTGWEPEATLGLRDQLSSLLALYTRESYAYRFPTLMDRYASYPGYAVANPALRPEQVMTALAGAEFNGQGIKAGFEGQAQFRNDAELFFNNVATDSLGAPLGETINSGHASELSLMPSLDWGALPFLNLYQAGRFSGSRVTNLGQKIPYDPFVTYLIELRAHPSGEAERWNASFGIRALSSVNSDYLGGAIPGYALAHLSARWNFWQGSSGASADGRGALALEGRIENLTDRKIQVITGYPLPGTLFALALTGTI